MPEETTPDSVAPDAVKEQPATAVKPEAKAKKEKPPALEDKPFPDFIQQDFIPALKAGFETQGIQGIELSLEKKKINVIGFSQSPDCWQVVGVWSNGYKQTREFNLYFLTKPSVARKDSPTLKMVAKPAP